MAESKHLSAADQGQKLLSRWRIKGLGLASLLVAAWCALMPATQSTQSRSMPTCRRNLHLIGLALHSYHEDYGCLPPAVVQSSDGQRMHSWRVLILPYLADLYDKDASWLKAHRYDFGLWESRSVRAREKIARRKARQIRTVLAVYHFSEPWDGPNNQRLVNATLDAFNCNHEDSDSTSDYLAVTGRETAWPRGAVSRFDDFRDGLSNMILVVEAVDSGIRWSEPQDLRFESLSFVVGAQGSREIRGPFPGYANVCLASGATRWISVDVEPGEVQALLTIDGQENLPRW